MCTVNYTRHKQDWIKTMQPHCRTVFNDIFQLTILMYNFNKAQMPRSLMTVVLDRNM